MNNFLCNAFFLGFLAREQIHVGHPWYIGTRHGFFFGKHRRFVRPRDHEVLFSDSWKEFKNGIKQTYGYCVGFFVRCIRNIFARNLKKKLFNRQKNTPQSARRHRRERSFNIARLPLSLGNAVIDWFSHVNQPRETGASLMKQSRNFPRLRHVRSRTTKTINFTLRRARRTRSCRLLPTLLSHTERRRRSAISFLREWKSRPFPRRNAQITYRVSR